MKENKVNPLAGNLLRELREQKLKMSYRRFAKALGIAPSTVYRWESGETNPTLTLVQTKNLIKLLIESGLDPFDDFPAEDFPVIVN